MEELVERNLGSLIQQSQGCFYPRVIAGGRGISRHGWGAAVDINIGSNPEGLESIQDPRLIEVMERWGFTSGHEWLIPDPGHFEYARPPEHRSVQRRRSAASTSAASPSRSAVPGADVHTVTSSSMLW